MSKKIPLSADGFATTRTERSELRREGYLARMEGFGEFDNPYSVMDERHIWWYFGWYSHLHTDGLPNKYIKTWGNAHSGPEGGIDTHTVQGYGDGLDIERQVMDTSHDADWEGNHLGKYVSIDWKERKFKFGKGETDS